MTDAEQFFAAAAGYIGRGRAMLAEDRLAELASLDAEAAVLAAQAGQLRAELMASHGERFTALVKELEAFAREMQERRKITADMLRGLSQFRRASMAYAMRDKGNKEG